MVNFNVNLVPVAFTTGIAEVASKVVGKLGWWTFDTRSVAVVSSVATAVSSLANNLLGGLRTETVTNSGKATNAFVKLTSSVAGVAAGLGAHKFLYPLIPVSELFTFKTIAAFTALVAVSRFLADAIPLAREDRAFV